jgi:2-polyprenyl-3-methyl-5-hydroxy-6-metoxy-1,4-benzoquinol methylase
MDSLKLRSEQKEIIDRDDLSFEDIQRNLQELAFINRYLGGHAATLKGFGTVIRNAGKAMEVIKVVEIGSGGGDNLRVIKRKAAKNGWRTKLTGVDIKENCIEFARQAPENAGIGFIHSDYKTVRFDDKPDIIFSSLFCHHFPDEELVRMLQWMQQNSRIGFFINDLHRHPLAFYSIKYMTRIFSKSALVKNDAPVSVSRGFKKKDWLSLLRMAGIKDFKLEWCWAFRWLLTSNQ